MIFQLYFQKSHLTWHIWHGSLIYSWASLVHISCFWLLHGTLVPVFSYSHNHVPLKPRPNEQYKVAFNIRLLIKSCLFGHLHFRHVTYTTFVESWPSNALWMHNTFRFDIGQNLVCLVTHFCNMQHDVHSFVKINLLNVECRM